MGLQATYFAPAGRQTGDNLRAQATSITSKHFFANGLNAMPMPVFVVNSFRQIVFANRALNRMVGASDPAVLLGIRPGELLGCECVDDGPDGCGTSPDCAHCSAVACVLNALDGNEDSRDTRIVRKADGLAMDLRITASPLAVGEDQFALVTAIDICNEKYRRSIERVFFHDLLNLAGGIHGLANELSSMMSASNATERDIAAVIAEGSGQLLEEIQGQKDLTSAAGGDIEIARGYVSALELVEKVVAIYRHHPAAAKQEIIVDPTSDYINLYTDSKILTRILGNLIKNAVEACQSGDCVRVGCYAEDGKVCFKIHNRQSIPREVQPLIFKGSYSTKGSDRGLGTYSVRLFTEKVLGGKVWFESSEKDGTTFCVEFNASENN